MTDSKYFGETVFSYGSPLGNEFRISRRSFSTASDKPTKRISFVAGLHGDELEGVHLCFRLFQYLTQLVKDSPHLLVGDVHIYPAVNPQALGNASRVWPFFETDMNRMFGRRVDSLPSHAADALIQDIGERSDLVVDIHSSNLHLREVPQVRIIEGFDKKLIPLAQCTNVDVVWVHPTVPVFEYTLGFGLNHSGIPALVIEAGICLKLDHRINGQLLDGAINLLCKTGVLDFDAVSIPDVRQPRLVNPDCVAQVVASRAGLFLARVKPGQEVARGELLGELVDPTEGILLEEVVSPVDGFLFTLRELPLTYEGGVLVRIAARGSFTS